MHLQFKNDMGRVEDLKLDNEIWHNSFGYIIQPFIITPGESVISSISQVKHKYFF